MVQVQPEEQESSLENELFLYLFLYKEDNTQILLRPPPMKYGVSRKTLLMTAGIVWLIAGANILRIGITCWVNYKAYWLFKVCEASLIFLLFFGFIFHRLYRKHTGRISQKEDKNCPFAFFDTKGWIIMAFMITFGVSARRFQLLPESFIAVFYTGLSLALMGTGIRFLIYWWKSRKLL